MYGLVITSIGSLQSALVAVNSPAPCVCLPLLTSQAAKKKAEAEKEAKREEAAAKAPNKRQIEMDRIQAKLTPLGYKIKTVNADGNCLYYALADQLKLAGAPIPGTEDGTLAHKALRCAAADHIEEHRTDFAPFLPYKDEPEAAQADPIGSGAFDRYMTKLRDTSAWGGEPELRALGVALECPITVYRALGDPLQVGERESGPALRISYVARTVLCCAGATSASPCAAVCACVRSNYTNKSLWLCGAGSIRTTLPLVSTTTP